MADVATAAPIKVFVGNLNFSTKNEDLKNAFESCGQILSAKVVRRGRRSLGYGFVEVPSQEVAQACVDKMNKKDMDGREINVEIAKPRDPAEVADKKKKRRRQRKEKSEPEGPPSVDTIFVAKIPYTYDEEDLKKLFAEFNPVRAQVNKKVDGRNKGFGFVQFADEATQKKAIEAMNGKTVDERELVVNVAKKGIPDANASGSE